MIVPASAGVVFFLSCNRSITLISSVDSMITVPVSKELSFHHQTPPFSGDFSVSSSFRFRSNTLPSLHVLYCTALVTFPAAHALYCTACLLVLQAYCTVLYCIARTVLYCTSCTGLDCMLLYMYEYKYCTVLHLCCTLLHCTVLYCAVLYCIHLYCPPVLSCPVLYIYAYTYCTALHLYRTLLHTHWTGLCTDCTLYCTVWYGTHTAPYCTIMYYRGTHTRTALHTYYRVPYCTILYCTGTYTCTVPYCTVLYTYT